MAQWIKPGTLDFGLGGDLRVVRSNPHSPLGVESAGDFLSLPQHPPNK